MRGLIIAGVWLPLFWSCAKDPPQTSGESHWLRPCAADAECGDGVCACGVCTLPCDADGACAALGGVCTGTCEGAQVCVAEDLPPADASTEEPPPAARALTGMKALGACAHDPAVDTLGLDLLLEDQNGRVLVGGEVEPSFQDFSFGEAEVEGGELEGPRPLALDPVGLSYQWAGGEGRRDDERLLVLAVDHSGSLIGQDPRTLQIDLTRAADRQDNRIAFLTQLVNDVPDDTWLSLVSFNGNFPDLNPDYATPTQAHGTIQEGLELLQRDEEGLTPLADALDSILRRVVEVPGNAELNPTVLLFTDGVERSSDGMSGGDTSNATLSGPEGVIERYATAGVPVIVLHLQSAPQAGFRRGRDPELVDLACRSGGEYIFLERAEELIESETLRALPGRLPGVWRLDTRTDLPLEAFAPGEYLLSTRLSFLFEARNAELDLGPDPDGLAHRDNRIWLQKR